MTAEREAPPGTILVPASTPAPLFAALGATLLASGLVTHAVVSVTGAVLLVAALVGWARAVLPIEQVEALPIERAPAAVVPSARPVAHPAPATGTPNRARLPIAVYPIAAGVRGGVAGGVAMALLALLWGMVVHGSPWWPVNVLAASAVPRLAAADAATLVAFDPTGLAVAVVVHALLSVLIGLLYGALLPMLPSHPALWGGIVAPLLWSGLLHATLRIVDPDLAARIAWPWFVVTQVAFGVVAGLVVARSEKVATFQHAPLRVRAGVETQDER